jgi:hypothetical protein
VNQTDSIDASGTLTNRALVFIKPNAVNSTFLDFFRQFTKGWSITLSEPLTITGPTIEAEGTVDRHYFAIARTAAWSRPDQYTLNEEAKKAFLDAYGISWDAALSAGLIVNALDAQKLLGGISGLELNEIWKKSTQVKMGPGLYAGKLPGDTAAASPGAEYVINGFYPGQREIFTRPDAQLLLFEASFDPETLDWKSFRSSVIGATDPAKAAAGSLRSELLKRWKELGLPSPPQMSSNGVHASAGPLEGLRERMVWLGIDPHATPFARSLATRGFGADHLKALLENHRITAGDAEGGAFDLTEDLDASEAVDLLASASLVD